jgi:hypothetical protein
VIRLEPEKRLPRWAVAVLAALVAAALAGGFLAGRARDRVEGPRGEGFLTAGPLTVTPSRDWQPAAPQRLDGLVLQNAASTRSDEAQLTAGTTDGEGPTLLPPAFAAQLKGRLEPEAVRLGRLHAFRYRRLRSATVPGGLTVYVLPTTKGIATLACTGRALADCEAVATTLTLHGARALPLHASQAYLGAVRRALARLDARRSAARRQLRRATGPALQARAATRLAAAYGAAAAALRKPKTGPIERPATEAAVTALDGTATAYRSLAAAARGGSSRAYRVAALKVGRSEAAVARALRALPG